MDHLPFRLSWHCQSARTPRTRKYSKLNRKIHKIRKTWIDIHPCPSFHLAVETVQNLFFAKPEKLPHPKPAGVRLKELSFRLIVRSGYFYSCREGICLAEGSQILKSKGWIQSN